MQHSLQVSLDSTSNGHLRHHEKLGVYLMNVHTSTITTTTVVLSVKGICFVFYSLLSVVTL